jgi:hypothetical protein
MLALVGVSAGCAHLPSGPFPPPAADVTSPLASEIAKLDPKDAPYPSFLSVPNRPQDVRPATAWTRNIYNTIRLRRQLRALAALNPQGLYGAEAFAKQARLEAATPLTPAEAAALTDNTTKFAKELRDRAKAPSPVN